MASSSAVDACGLAKQQPGAKKKDLSAQLGGLVWPVAPSNFKCIVSNTMQLYWKLPCGLHLRYMTVQAAMNQHKNPKHPGVFAACERCAVGPYRVYPPEPQPHDKRRSYYEITAWLALENVLCKPEVMEHISLTAPAPRNMMLGVDLGYVVEAKVVKMWKGGADVYIPGLNMILQVDGEHHDKEVQQDVDIDFMLMAKQQRFNVLRLYYGDIRRAYAEVAAMVEACMQSCGKEQPVARCSKNHVLLQHAMYNKL